MKKKTMIDIINKKEKEAYEQLLRCEEFYGVNAETTLLYRASWSALYDLKKN